MNARDNAECARRWPRGCHVEKDGQGDDKGPNKGLPLAAPLHYVEERH